MSKSGRETKDIISPLSESMSNPADPLELNNSMAFKSSFLIKYCMLVSKVNFKGW